MYIELFLLDNLLMDLLILRLAAAMLSIRASFWRSSLFALLGAAAAAAAAGGAAFLLSPAGKLGLTLLMSFAVPGKRLRSRACAFGAVLLASAIVGGAVLLAAIALGEELGSGGIGLHAALIGFFAASFLPRAIRKLLSRRIAEEKTVRLRAEFTGCGAIECAALIDTGNALKSPIGGLPVIVLSRRKYPEAAALASIPIPIRTAAGSAVIYALRPKKLLLNGAPANALIAFSSAETALVPPAAVPAA